MWSTYGYSLWSHHSRAHATGHDLHAWFFACLEQAWQQWSKGCCFWQMTVEVDGIVPVCQCGSVNGEVRYQPFLGPGERSSGPGPRKSLYREKVEQGYTVSLVAFVVRREWMEWRGG